MIWHRERRAGAANASRNNSRERQTRRGDTRRRCVTFWRRCVGRKSPASVVAAGGALAGYLDVAAPNDDGRSGVAGDWPSRSIRRHGRSAATVNRASRSMGAFAVDGGLRDRWGPSRSLRRYDRVAVSIR